MFVNDILTALESSSALDRKHVLQLLQLYGDQALKKVLIFFSILFLRSIFNIEKKCVLTILKTINHKTINSDMWEGRATYFHQMCSRLEHLSKNKSDGKLGIYQRLDSAKKLIQKYYFKLCINCWSKTSKILNNWKYH